MGTDNRVMPKGSWVSDGRGGWKRGKIEADVMVQLRSSGDASGFHVLTNEQREHIGKTVKILDMGTTKYQDGHTSRIAMVEVDGKSMEWPYGWWVLDDGNVLDAPVLVKASKKSDGAAGPVEKHGNLQAKRLAQQKKQREDKNAEILANETNAEPEPEPVAVEAEPVEPEIADCIQMVPEEEPLELELPAQDEHDYPDVQPSEVEFTAHSEYGIKSLKLGEWM